METIFRAHHAAISPRLQQRAEQKIRKLVQKLGRTVDAVVRVEGDGPTCRVEVELHAARARRMVAEGTGRSFSAALTGALTRLDAQIARVRTRRAVARKVRLAAATRTRRTAGA